MKPVCQFSRGYGINDEPDAPSPPLPSPPLPASRSLALGAKANIMIQIFDNFSQNVHE